MSLTVDSGLEKEVLHSADAESGVGAGMDRLHKLRTIL